MASETLNRGGSAPSAAPALRDRLAARVRAARHAVDAHTMIPARTPGGPARLSLAEEQLWYLEQFLGGTPTYNISRAWRVRGPLDRVALRSSADQLVGRHASLRTTIASGDAGGQRTVHLGAEAAWHAIDRAGVAPDLRAIEAVRLGRESAAEPFDLETGPLLRFQLVTFAPDDHVFSITLHHIIADGWSLGLMLRELGSLYRARTAGVMVDLRLPPREYGDFALWQHAQAQADAFAPSLAYWEETLRGAPAVLDLPTDRPRPAAPTYRGELARTRMPADQVEELARWSAREQTSLFAVLLAAFQVLLHRLSGEEDLVVGSPFACRSRPELEPIVGYFANMLPLRTSFAGSPGFRDVVQRVRRSVQEAVDHQEVPFAAIVERLRPTLRHAGLNPIFQTAFVLESRDLVGEPGFPGTRVEMVPVDTDTAKFDLALLAIETEEGIELTIEASADLFERTTATRLLEQFQHLLRHLLAHPEQPVDRAPLMSTADRQHILQHWSGVRASYPRSSTVHALFSDQARRRADAPALLCGERTMTYDALNQAAAALARRLRESGVRPGEFVAIAADRSMEFVVAVLAVLKAGAAYVPLDVQHPRSWLARILEQVRPSALLVAGHYLDVLPPAAVPVLKLDEAVMSASEPLPEDADGPANASSAAYVMFTSGSTGQPKGTVVPHRAIVRLVRGTDFVPFSTHDRFLLLANLAFDASTFELWGPLLNGGQLVIPAHPQPTLAQIAESVQRHRITTLWLTSGLFNLMVEERLPSLAGVRHLLTGGDALSTTHVAKALAALPHTQLINGYGPTENTVFTTCHAITPPDVQRRGIPIGRPIANTRVYILDARGEPAPVGIPGELYAGGDGVAHGYLNEPALTDERFVPDPFSGPGGDRLYRTGDRCRWREDGTIEFLGRMDQELKIRGFRVDPGEIESALALLPGVGEAAVVARTRTGGEKELVGCVVAANGAALVPARLREQLATRVPPHMVPASITVIARMPLTGNGKVDRGALASLPREAGSSETEGPRIAPRTETERRLEGIWKTLLGCEAIDMRDDFFALGGHSLMAMRLMHRIHEEFGKTLPLAALLTAPTIEELAARLSAATPAGPASASTSTSTLRGSGPGAPLFFIPGLGGYEFLPAPVARALVGCCPYFDGLQIVGVDRQSPPLEDLRLIASDLIRQIRAVRPTGPYNLCGYCYGGVVAFEVARQLEEAGESVPALVIWHGYPVTTPWPRRPVPEVLRALRQRFLDTPSGQRTRMLLDKSLLALRMLGWKAKDAWNRLRGRPRSLIPHNVFFPDVMDPAVVYANLRARGRYQPAPYRGRAFLLLGTTERLLYRCPPLVGWEGLLLGGVQIFQHPVEHMELVGPPVVEYLGEQTAACFTAAHLGTDAQPTRGFAAVPAPEQNDPRQSATR